MKLRCVKGNIGIDGVRYSVGDVFDAADDIVDTLVDGKWAVVDTEPMDMAVDAVPSPDHASHFADVDDEAEEVMEEPVKPKRGRPRK